jgi:hypothetical protein
MISQVVLGATEINVSLTAHSCGHDSEDWGGIPVVVLFGDLEKLPPPFGIGAVDAFFNQGNSHISRNGAQNFVTLGSQMLELTKMMHQNKKDRAFRKLLQRVRLGQPS